MIEASQGCSPGPFYLQTSTGEEHQATTPSNQKELGCVLIGEN